MSAVDHSVSLGIKIAVPLLMGILILFILALIFRNRWQRFCPCIRRSRAIDYNAPPAGHYKPLRRWSNTSWTTSVAGQSRGQPNSQDILSLAEIGEAKTDLSPPVKPADTAVGAPIALHWHTRQQNRSALNNTALRTLRKPPNQEMLRSEQAADVWPQAEEARSCKRDVGGFA